MAFGNLISKAKAKFSKKPNSSSREGFSIPKTKSSIMGTAFWSKSIFPKNTSTTHRYTALPSMDNDSLLPVSANIATAYDFDTDTYVAIAVLPIRTISKSYTAAGISASNPMVTIGMRPASDDTVTVPVVFDTFTPFGRLPRELQIKIWKAAVPTFARVIHLYEDDLVGKVGAATQRVLIPLLKACHLSNHLVEKQFSKARALGDFGLKGMDRRDIIHIDFSRDTLFFHTDRTYMTQRILCSLSQYSNRRLIKYFTFQLGQLQGLINMGHSRRAPIHQMTTLSCVLQRFFPGLENIYISNSEPLPFAERRLAQHFLKGGIDCKSIKLFLQDGKTVGVLKKRFEALGWAWRNCCKHDKVEILFAIIWDSTNSRSAD